MAGGDGWCRVKGVGLSERRIGRGRGIFRFKTVTCYCSASGHTLLRQYQLEPEIFVWCSTPPGNLVTMHLSLRPEDGRSMPAITDLLKENPAVHRVSPCDLNDFRSGLSRILQTTVHRTPG